MPPPLPALVSVQGTVMELSATWRDAPGGERLLSYLGPCFPVLADASPITGPSSCPGLGRRLLHYRPLSLVLPHATAMDLRPPGASVGPSPPELAVVSSTAGPSLLFC